MWVCRASLLFSNAAYSRQTLPDGEDSPRLFYGFIPVLSHCLALFHLVLQRSLVKVLERPWHESVWSLERPPTISAPALKGGCHGWTSWETQGTSRPLVLPALLSEIVSLSRSRIPAALKNFVPSLGSGGGGGCGGVWRPSLPS
jgi:hypothetical protein